MSDKVYELVLAPPSKPTHTGYIAQRLYSFWGPRDILDDGTIIEGISVLRSLPESPLWPAKFQQGFLKEFESTMSAVEKNTTTNAHLSDWLRFASLYPNTEDVRTFVIQNPDMYKIPMINTKLFSFMYIQETFQYSRTPYHPYLTSRIDAENNPDIPEVLAPHGIRWSKRYAPLLSRCPIPNGDTPISSLTIQEEEELCLKIMTLELLIKLPLTNLKAICQRYHLDQNGRIVDLANRIMSYRDSIEAPPLSRNDAVVAEIAQVTANARNNNAQLRNARPPIPIETMLRFSDQQLKSSTVHKPDLVALCNHHNIRILPKDKKEDLVHKVIAFRSNRFFNGI
jgi:hypothetical protein